VSEPPAARSWSEVVKQVTETSPDDAVLRASASAADQATQVLRCFKLEDESYCLGLGFVDQLPTGAQLSEAVSTPDASETSPRTTAEPGAVEPGAIEPSAVEPAAGEPVATGALSPAQFVAERTALPKSARMTAELEEMQTAWDGRDKARALRLLDADGNPPSTPQPGTPEPIATPTPTGTPTPTPTGTPTKPSPPPVETPTPVKPLPVSNYIMKGYQTSQEKGYWCGPATFQSIDWADDNQRDTQASWAKDLGTTSSGTGISAMVQQTNLKTKWDIAAGTYIVQNVGHWTPQKFFEVHQNHLGDGAPAPVIEHVQLLKRYFPYLAFNHSGHYQVGRGYDRNTGTIGIFEVFDERRFNSRGNVTDGPKNIPATALFNATLANSFQNIGL
jgi:hypothetical protein